MFLHDYSCFHSGLTVQRAAVVVALLALACLLVSPATTVQAGAIYKSVDKDGNIIFTDRPLEGAENITGEETTATSPATSETPQGEGKADDEDEADFDSEDEPEDSVALAPEPKNPPKSTYRETVEPAENLPVTVVEILTPIHDTILHDPYGKIWVEVQSYPTPMKKNGLTAELWMNDTLVTTGKRPMLSLPVPERGTHVLQVKLVDAKGRVQIKSAATHIHVKYRVGTN